jgi:ribonucleoside-diphosphate reductase alpha chain
VNLEYYEQWKDNPDFISDILRFLDNVLKDFIDNAPESMKNATYSAMRERSIGLGVMGLHSFFQAQNIPIESVMAKVWNKKIFEHIDAKVKAASQTLAEEKGSCPDAIDAGMIARFSNATAVAPTASISIIANNSSPGIEPYAANSFTQKTLSGSFVVRNKNLEKLLEEKGQNSEKTWSSISANEGSVQHLEFLSEHEKLVFKTAYEIDQRWLIDLAADRTAFIDQSQSLNIFLPSDVHKKYLHDIHFRAWKSGVKSMYYLRTFQSIQRAENLNKAQVTSDGAKPEYDECLSCQ